MKNSQNKKKIQIALLVLIAVLTLGIGYASITAVNLIINGNGTATANQENFKVYFTESTITEGKGTVSIDEDDATIGYFDITGLSKEGDYAEATYTVLNNSNGVGANITLDVTNANTEYFKVTETVADSELQAGDDTTATVKIEMIKTPLDNDVSTSVTAKLIASPIDNASATGNTIATIEKPTVFEGDSWATIKTNVINGNTSQYNVGDTKKVTINNTKYTVRLVNKTIGEHCGDNDIEHSQTACGFVVEFAEIVEKRAMNSPATNIGGWPGSNLHTYLEGDFYNSLPSDLKAVIKPTRVISGYGCVSNDNPCTNPDNNGNNYSSTDNLYLLSAVEIFGSDDYDIAASTTTQLDYYKGMELDGNIYGIQTYSRTYKEYNGSDGPMCFYWLRSAYSSYDDSYRAVIWGNIDSGYASNSSGGFAPAFRIG